MLSLTVSTLPAQTRIDSTSDSKPDTQVVAENYGWVSLQSNPEGAEVYQDSLFLGKTPVVRYPVREGNRVFRLFYPDTKFWNAEMKADSIVVQARQEMSLSVILNVPSGYGLQGSDVPHNNTNPDLFLATKEKRDSRLWMVYTAGATMILSGVLSAYLKTKSDKDFDSYVATNDPGLFASTQRLDRWSGVSLFVAELSLGTLMYLLLSE